MDGIFNPEYPEPTSTGSMGNKALAQLPAFKAVVEGAPVMEFFSDSSAAMHVRSISNGFARQAPGQALQFITILSLWGEARRSSTPAGHPLVMCRLIWDRSSSVSAPTGLRRFAPLMGRQMLIGI